MNPNMNSLRVTSYSYHRGGLDGLFNQDQTQAKKIIFDALMQLKTYENSFQQNYFFNLFMQTKRDEIYNIFGNGNNGGINLNDLKQLMITFVPKDTDTKWNKWR